MIELEKLDLFSCFLCGKRFHNHCDVYTISSHTFDDREKKFEDSIINTNYGTVHRKINFHRHCFANVAGNKYMP